ncbi:MAG: hypothetical protein RL038_670 [Actinomycetota bacterium]|jgi:hypothetical protein
MTNAPEINQVFVGGSGRSGTTITGFILGKHAKIWNTLPREVRFMSDPGGLLDLALGADTRIQYLTSAPDAERTGRAKLKEVLLKVRGSSKKPEDTNLAEFLDKMRGKWWYRTGPDGGPRGFHRGYNHEQFLEVVAQFEAEYAANPIVASQDFVARLLGDKAKSLGAETFVDTTPLNGENAHRIIQLLPHAKAIHLVRDGRDTVSSVLTKNWGPDQPIYALKWWYDRTLRAHLSAERCPSNQVLEVNMDDLITYDRDAQLNRLFNFLGYEPDASVKTFFAENVNADRGNQGRWRKDISPAILKEFDDTYADMHAKLVAAGVPLRPIES